MDQAFGTTGAGGYRAGGCALESSNRKEFRRCLYQGRLFGCTITFPDGLISYARQLMCGS